MYSNTLLTPSPVFADVQNNWGRISGSNSSRGITGDDGCWVGVTDWALRPAAKRLGVIVTPELDDVVDRERRERYEGEGE
jgi:hypothetical protein